MRYDQLITFWPSPAGLSLSEAAAWSRSFRSTKRGPTAADETRKVTGHDPLDEVREFYADQLRTGVLTQRDHDVLWWRLATLRPAPGMHPSWEYVAVLLNDGRPPHGVLDRLVRDLDDADAAIADLTGQLADVPAGTARRMRADLEVVTDARDALAALVAPAIRVQIGDAYRIQSRVWDPKTSGRIRGRLTAVGTARLGV